LEPTGTSPSAEAREPYIERLYEEFKRRIKTQTVLPSANTAAMLFWAMLASGQINIARPTAGKRSLPSPVINQLTSPLDQIASSYRRLRRGNSNHMPGSTEGEYYGRRHLRSRH
jgi:hypothetical protein